MPGERDREPQPTLAERVAALEARVTSIEDWERYVVPALDQQIKTYDEHFAQLDRQASNPNDSPAGYQLRSEIGQIRSTTAGLVKDVGALEEWRKGLLRDIRATLRVFRVGAAVVAGAFAFVITVTAVLSALHQLGVIR